MLGKPQKILKNYTKSDPEDPDGWTLLAFTYRKLDKFAVFENKTSIRNLKEKLFNDTNSLSIMNTERNMRALDLFRLIILKFPFLVKQMNRI